MLIVLLEAKHVRRARLITKMPNLLDSWLTAQDQVTYRELIHDTLTAQQALSKEYQR